MWAMGDYPAVAADVIPDLGSVLVEACGVRAWRHGARRGLRVGQRRHPGRVARCAGHCLRPDPGAARSRPTLAASRDAEISWREGDAESLPFADGTFDVVLSCVGVMFAPHHQTSADELLRVCRPGGTIGLVNWTPEGFVGQMFAAMKPYSPPPPPGAQPPPLWGDENHVRALLGDRVTDVVTSRRDGHRGSLRVHLTRSATTSRRTTGRRSPPTEVSPTNPSGSSRTRP